MTFFPLSFDEADEPWIPTLLDILYLRSQSTPGFTNVGMDSIVLKTEWSYLTTHWSEITQRFNQRYANRRINSETLERWQVRLQEKVDEIGAEYNRAFSLYSANSSLMTSDVSQGTTRTYNTVNRTIDTPDAAINASDDYADALAKQTGTVTDKVNGQIVEDVNRSIDAYRDLDTQFVKEFENLFLNIFWS